MFKFSLMGLIVLISAPVFAKNLQQDDIDVVYGVDNRQDLYQVKNPLHLKLAASTAGMVSLSLLGKKNAADTVAQLARQATHELAGNICPSEKFSQQIVAPQCSGFLIGPDTLVTAGHCYLARGTKEENCQKFAWVFDYAMKSATTNPGQNIPMSNIYFCKSVLAAVYQPTMDFSIIKLDRAVTGRAPLKYRESGIVSSSANLVVIGHPSGLPTKVSDKGRVTSNSAQTTFSTTLDTFHGNSGSAVFDSKTGVIEGILIQGKTDYVPSKKDDPKSCKVLNVCDDSAMNCTAGAEEGSIAQGEVVLRIAQLANVFKEALKIK